MGLFQNLFFLAVGIYGGIYADQNYEVSKAPSPKELYRIMEEYFSKYKKKD